MWRKCQAFRAWQTVRSRSRDRILTPVTRDTGGGKTTLRHSSDRTDLTTPPAPAPDGVVPAFSNGSLIDGKYLVEETMAEGGIGVVVAARHLALDQRVAIKYLKPAARDNPAILERFVREGRLAAQIASDHVVRVHDVGAIADGGPYIVMEYLVGEDLGHVVRRGPVPVARAVDYILQACDALAEAHGLQIVHRDIKPANLFLAERPSNTPILKIIDFGISKAIPQRSKTASWGRQTEDGDRFGTPLYMSPEQLRSTSNVDARADIWALGVVLHELLTGELPFEGDDLPQLCASILIKPPVHLTAALRGAPVELETIILKCLEKDRLRRFRNVAELAQELVPFGPADASTRAARIMAVVRSAGASIRPPTPMPGTLKVEDIAAYLPPVAPANSANTTVTSVGRAAQSWRPVALGAALAIVACLLAFAVAILVRQPGDASAERRAALSPVTAPAPAPPTATAATAPPSPPALSGEAAASSASRATNAASGSGHSQPTTAAKAARALFGEPAAPTATPPKPRTHDRSEFGERE
jgi:serine/threonine protein kinase